MAQISKGDTFLDGEQVTGARLNQLVDASTLLVGAIADQPSITANTLEATDSTIVNDAGTLKEATIGDILNSNLPISTSSITGGAGVDITVTPASGQKMDVGGAFEAESINVIGNSTIGGNQTITGDLTVTGSFGGNINTAGNITSSGTANFTGTLQVNGETSYVLTEIYEHTIPTYIALVGGQFNNIYTSPTFTKPTGEIWVIEMQAVHSGKGGYVYEFAVRYGSQTPTTGSYIGYERFHDGSGGGAHCIKTYLNRWVFQSSDTFTNETIRVDCNLGNGSEFQFAPTIWQYGGFVASVMATPSKFRIYKYKTA